MKQRRFVEVYFLVRGSGDFPLDMLRYDSCHPARETDSYKMERHEKRVILLRRFSPERYSEGNEARWRSFQWEVIAWAKEMYQLTDHPDVKDWSL